MPIVAAPAVCGVAAAFALASPATANASAASAAKAPAHHTAATAARRQAAKTARLASVTKPAAKKAAAAGEKYTVKSGDTLSAIAGHFYHSTKFWPAIYWANHTQVRYADDIQAGQVLTVPVKPSSVPAAPSVLAPAPAPVRTPVVETQSAPAAAAQDVTVETTPVESAPAASTAVSTAGDSSFQQCVINAESGGNSQVMNSSGHYGLYQFSASTWAAYGGNPADFGDASVSEQNQVFDNAIAAGGESNWAPYDGC